MYDGQLLREIRKKEHKCTRCGSLLPPDHTKTLCARCTQKQQKHADKAKAKRQKRKSNNQCTLCGNSLEASRIGKSFCENCAKKYTASRSRFYNYGLSDTEYNLLLQKSDNKCQICGSSTNLVVDHDHITKKVRGILCNKCNWGLGNFSDNVLFLLNAAKYLQNTKT